MQDKVEGDKSLSLHNIRSTQYQYCQQGYTHYQYCTSNGYTPYLPQFSYLKPSVSLLWNLKLQPWASFSFSTAISRCIVSFSQKLKLQPMLPSFLLTFTHFYKSVLSFSKLLNFCLCACFSCFRQVVAYILFVCSVQPEDRGSFQRRA